MFGINAELLIDHAWGYEPVTIDMIKAYKPQTNSISSGQVLQCPYEFEKGRLIVREMTDLLVLDLVEKGLVTDQMVLTIGYDIDNLTDKDIRSKYKGDITTDRYGRKVPKHAHGSINLCKATASTQIITDAVMELYDRIVNPNLLIRRVTVVANNVVEERKAAEKESIVYEQLDLFTDYNALQKEREEENIRLAKERKMQEAMISVKKKYGKNAMIKGMNLQEGGTTIQRNNQIGGHKA
jgi:DNA polymerase V